MIIGRRGRGMSRGLVVVCRLPLVAGGKADFGHWRDRFTLKEYIEYSLSLLANVCPFIVHQLSNYACECTFYSGRWYDVTPL
jgi:hypothetical protein